MFNNFYLLPLFIEQKLVWQVNSSVASRVFREAKASREGDNRAKNSVLTPGFQLLVLGNLATFAHSAKNPRDHQDKKRF